MKHELYSILHRRYAMEYVLCLTVCRVVELEIREIGI